MAVRIMTCREFCGGSRQTSASTTCTTRIPYYRLQRALRDHPELREVSLVTLLQSFTCVRLALWDEGRGRLISFREMRHLY